MSEVLKDFSANIDLKQSLVNEDVKVVEGDNGNVLVLNIVKDGLPVDLTDCLVQIVFAHSGRTVWQDSSSPTGGITISGDDNNIVTVRLHSDSYAPNGITVCQVKVYSGVGQETLVSSARFSFKSELSLLNAETVESIEQYSILVTLIETVNGMLDRDQADWDETDTLKVSFVRNKPVADIDAHASRHYNGGADPIAPALIGAEAMRMVFDGVTVATTGWATYTPSGDEETAIAALGFTYKKTVTLENVTADMDVAVDPLSDYYSCGADVCSIAVPTTDGVVLYANAVPTSAFTINATAWRAAGDVPGVDETIGAQIIADAAAAVASAESAVSDAVSAKNAAETAQGASEAAQLAAESARDDAEEAVASIPSTHNGFSGLQGGAALERYHMTAEQNTALHAHANKAALDNVTGTNTGDQAASSFNHNDLANKQGGTTNQYYHVTAAEKTVIQNTSGTNTGDQDVSGAISTHNTDAGAHAELFIIIRDGRVYTLRWDKVNSKGVRLNNAQGISTTITNFCHRGTVNTTMDNPFDSIYPWSEINLCNISIDEYRALTPGSDIRDCAVSWLGDVDFSYGHENGVYVFRPEHFTRVIDDGPYRYIDISNKEIPGSVKQKARMEGRYFGVPYALTIDGISKTCLLPKPGMPGKNIAMSMLHSYAKNWGASLENIFGYSDVNALMAVEYATLNSQDAVGNGVSDLYRQNGYTIKAAASNTAVVKILTADASTFCIVGAIFDIGTTDGNYNVGSYIIASTALDADPTYTNVTLTTDGTTPASVTVTTAHYWSVHGLYNAIDSAIGAASGYIGTNGRCNAYYRGQIAHANIFRYILGAYRKSGNGGIWIANSEEEADAYDALNQSVHYDTGLLLPQGTGGAATGGYIQTLGLHDGLLAPLCTAIGGGSINPVGDYCYAPSLATGDTALIAGGNANSGTGCGRFYGYWNNSAANSYWHCAAVPVLKSPM